MHRNVNFNYLEKCEAHLRDVNWAKCFKDLFTYILEHFIVIALSELCCKRAPVYTSVFTQRLLLQSDCYGKVREQILVKVPISNSINIVRLLLYCYMKADRQTCGS